MYNIIVFGTGSTAINVIKSLKDNINILAYADNNKEKWNDFFYDKEIINPININNYSYDYIVIASQFNEEILTQLLKLGIKKEKIFQYFKFVNFIWNEFELQMSEFYQCKDEVECIATGISYTYNGLEEKLLEKKCAKFSLASQDLFYDYNIAKYILKSNLQNIKYFIIGLSYYSFQYDLSLSAMRDKCMIYYNLLKTLHHFNKNIDEYLYEYKINAKIADKIILSKKDGDYIFNYSYRNLSSTQVDQKGIGKIQAEMDCNKDYPNTVKENIAILKKYLKLLNANNIKPVIVIYPTSSYYYNNFSIKIENEFKNIINKIRKEFSFQYLDYFRSNLFSDEDFRDVSHLNKRGAAKFTHILNHKIIW